MPKINESYEEIKERNLKSFIDFAYKIKLKREPTIIEYEEMKTRLKYNKDTKFIINNLFIDESMNTENIRSQGIEKIQDRIILNEKEVNFKLSIETTSPLAQFFRKNL
jgi:hypothetical protein